MGRLSARAGRRTEAVPPPASRPLSTRVQPAGPPLVRGRAKGRVRIRVRVRVRIRVRVTVSVRVRARFRVRARVRCG